MRRLRWLALATTCAVAVLTQLAAAGSAQVASATARTAPVTISFWNYWDGNNAKAIEALVARFNQTHPGIRVKNVTFPWGNLFQKMQAAAAGGDLPDVAAGDIAWMANLHRSGKLADLSKAARNSVNLNDFYPELLRYSTYRGRLEALPVSTNNLALFYNKDLFRRAGLDPNRPPRSWVELRQAAIKIAALGGGIQGFEIFTQPGEGLTWQFQPYIWQAGGEYLKPPTYTEPGFDNRAGRRALNFLAGLILSDKVAQAGQWGAFDKGQAGMRVDGSWMVSIYKAQAPFDFGTAMIPVCNGCSRATNMGGEQIFVFKGAPQKVAAATTFAIWLASTKVQVEWDTKTAFMPVRASVAKDKGFLRWVATEPRFKPFVEQQRAARARPPIPQYSATSDAFSKEIEKAFYGKVSVSEALRNADAAVRQALRS